MKRFEYVIALSIALLGVSATASAQMQPGMIDMTPSMNARVTNMNSDLAMAEYNRRNAGKRTEELEAKGKLIIQAGKATTMFVPTVAGTKWLAGDLTWEKEYPTLELQVGYIQKYVRAFNVLMSKRGFTPNDYADGFAFAYALAYAARYDKEMNKSELEKLRANVRRDTLTSPGYQGSSNEGKQWTYERNAVFATQAAEKRALARQATNQADRQKYEELASQNAEVVLGKQ